MERLGYIPGDSFLHRLDPRTKLALLALVSVVSMQGKFPLLLALTALLGAAFADMRVSMRGVCGAIRYFLYLLGGIFIVRLFGEGSGWLPQLDISTAGPAALFCWRLLIVVLGGAALIIATSTAALRGALVWLLAPVPFVNGVRAAAMLALLVRFLPLILDEAAQTGEALKSRNIEQRRNPFIRPIYFTGVLFRRVFARADELSDALQSRCFSDNRTPPPSRFGIADGMVIVSSVISMVILLVYLWYN
jgi:biotin transport system permease protein